MLARSVAQGDASVRFSGSLTGQVGWELCDECQPYQPVRTHWEAQGDVSPLGRTKAGAVHCADDRGGGFNGRITFVAAGGELRATYTFHTVSETPALLTLQLTGHFVPGGTGPFARASGSFVADVYAHTTTVPPTVETIWPLELVFEGTLGGLPATT